MSTAGASSYRNIITGILISSLLGVVVVGLMQILGFSGLDHLGIVALLPVVLGLVMGFLGSIWWRRERERWPLLLIVLIEAILLLSVCILCGTISFIGFVLIALGFTSIFIYTGARLGYSILDS